jgi:hypothetical protein
MNATRNNGNGGKANPSITPDKEARYAYLLDNKTDPKMIIKKLSKISYLQANHNSFLKFKYLFQTLKSS